MLELHVEAGEAPLPYSKSPFNRVSGLYLGLVVPVKKECIGTCTIATAPPRWCVNNSPVLRLCTFVCRDELEL